mgnify:CR=1 FL=1
MTTKRTLTGVCDKLQTAIRASHESTGYKKNTKTRATEMKKGIWSWPRAHQSALGDSHFTLQQLTKVCNGLAFHGIRRELIVVDMLLEKF